MKRDVLIVLLMLSVFFAKAQTDGISYQAVIIDNNPQEIPGVDILSNNLPNAPLKVRFSIIDDTTEVEYQETHDTETDAFGMINLMIGQGELTSGTLVTFNQVYWDNEKFLRVEIDLLDGNGYVLFSYQELTYIPYVRHREIIASSTLDVNGETNLNSSLSVNNASTTNLSGSLTTDGVTNLNNNLTVNNQSPTYLTGDLTVDGLVSFDGELEVGGDTQLYSDLTVGGNALLEGDLNVIGTSNFTDAIFDTITVNQNSSLNTLSASGATNLGSTLEVLGTTTIYDVFNAALIANLNSAVINQAGFDPNLNSLIVHGRSLHAGRVLINPQLTSLNQNSPQSYPLEIDGSRHGLWISVDGLGPGGAPNNSNNFVTFADNNDVVRGRVEGQVYGELTSSFPFVWNQTQEGLETAFQAAMVVVDVIGIDDGDAAIVEGIEMIDMIANWVVVRTHMINTLGVAFESGSGDYAEWLEKRDLNELFSYGDIVSVKGGKITKNTSNANHYMVVSYSPIVLGNMPDENREKDFEKIAFMGQVPVKVLGVVSEGDYIVPSGLNDGIGRAISPERMTVNDYKMIVGVAWSKSDANGISYINLAVGINTNDTLLLLEQQQDDINLLKSEVNGILSYLKEKDPDFDTKSFKLSKYTIKDQEIVNNDNENQSHNTVGNYPTAKSKYELILKLLEENPEIIEEILADARAYLDAKKVDYKLYEQTNRAVTDKNYLLDNLKIIVKNM